MENKGNNKHYVCTGGCGGVSETPGACQAEDCPDHGKPLKGCDCAEGKHENIEAEQKEE